MLVVFCVGEATFVAVFHFPSVPLRRGSCHNATTLPVTVTVPDVDNDDSVLVIGADANQLALRATVACGGGTSAMWFNPATNSTTVVLGPPVNGGGVLTTLLYPTPLD